MMAEDNVDLTRADVPDKKDKGDLTYSYESYGSPVQEYFPIPTNVKCPQALASYNADLPPVFKANAKDKFYTRHVIKRNKIHQIKNLTFRPNGSVPPNALNAWRDLTPDVKLPDIRSRTQGDIYYTRGKIGEKLNRSKPEFDLSDPVNKRKVLDTEKYSALHDPNLRSYFLRPSVKKHLRKQGLINERNEVLCGINEFNQFRSYLGELFNDQVKRRITENNAMEDMERKLTIAVNSKQRRKEIDAHNTSQLKHREMNLAYREARKRRYIAKIQLWERRLLQIDRYRSQVKLAHTGMYTVKHWNAFLTRQKAAKTEERRKQHTLVKIAYAETKNDYVTKYDNFVRLALAERYKADQAAVMIARDDQIDDMEELVEETLLRARKHWLKKYDHFIQHCRENPLSHYQILLKTQHRRKFLMKKYFYKWISYIISQRESRPNEAHQSVFQIERKLKPFIDNLKTFSTSDFEPDNELCGAGDHECKTKKLKKITKLTNLVKVFPQNETSKPKIMSMPSTAAISPAEKKAEVISSSEEKRRKKKKKKKEKEEDDGNEADVEEPDDFIDKMIARYRLDQEMLRKKLESIPPSRMPTLGYRHHVPKELLSGQDNINPLDDIQEDQKETIVFLRDNNDVVSEHEKLKGWKAMKL